MLNMATLVGRITYIGDNFILITIPAGNKTKETIEVKVSFSSDNLIKRVNEYVKIRDIVGVKGSLTNNNGLDSLGILAEKVTFLSSDQKGGE